jgi:hypothetical protein
MAHSDTTAGRRALALVHRGPPLLPGCPEAVAGLLASGPWDLDVRFTGPDEAFPLSAESPPERAVLYAQPRGGTLSRAYRKLRRQRRAIRDFVHDSGRCPGFCLGGYLAGVTPGFGLPGWTIADVTMDGSRTAAIAIRSG